ncbi:MAG: MarR family transcriptional regulator [Symbiobacteriaceae bacterium]|nr:MarR family transcriptional regulator [Symbiobacteriaceae bacterium]
MSHRKTHHLDEDDLVSELMKFSHAYGMVMRPQPSVHPESNSFPHRSFFLLGFLHRQEYEGSDPVSQSGIASELRLAAPTVTLMLNDLENSGLVERTRDSKDRRIVRVRLTPKGDETLQEQIKLHRQRVEKLLQCFGEDNASQLIALLRRMVNCANNCLQTKEGR